MENNPYFVGTNYSPSFSSSELSTLFAHADDLTPPQNFSTPLRGNFEFNMTSNASILSIPLGSVGCYSTGTSSIGLWTAGKPNAISVTILRIGYITISNNAISLYEDPVNTPAVATARTSNYGNGFLQNNLVPTAKMPRTNLFHPGS